MSCSRSKLNRHLAALCFILLVCAMSWCGTANATIIAQEDFESYTSIPYTEPTTLPDFGEAGENGPGGWTSAWAEDESPVYSYIRDNLFGGYGQGLEIANRNSGDTNIVTRQFAGQTDDFYVAFTMRTTVDDAQIHNHTMFYFSNSTGDDITISYGAGTKRVSSGGPGPFFVRQGDSTSDTVSTADQVYGDVYNFVLKFSKSGIATDPFDGIDLWINQATEGTPDITSTTGTASLAELNTFHVWFDPENSPEAGVFGYLSIDNLVVATTYDEARTLINNPIPEPSSALLACVAIALFGIRRQGRWAL